MFLNFNNNVKTLKNLLGCQKNILNVEIQKFKIKIFLKTTKIIDINKLNKIKYITGVIVTTKYIIIIVGEKAQEIGELLLKK